MDIKETYFRLMKETSEITDSIILEAIISDYHNDESLCALLLELPEKRARSPKPKSRPAIFRFSYEAAGGKRWEDYKDAAAALEMLNLSTYVLNYFLDDKGGQRPIQQRKNECIASTMLREIAQRMLGRVFPKLSKGRIVKVAEAFSEINEYTSGVGQYLDGNRLREVEDDHLGAYIARCEGLTGMFMANVAAIGGVIAGAPVHEVRALKEFGRNYGIMIQILNDAGDFMPYNRGNQSVGKVYQDQYSDLRHGCLTFPAYHVLLNGNDDEKKAVLKVQGSLNADKDDCERITRAFVRLNGIDEVKKLAGFYAKKAKQALHTLPKSEARDFLSAALAVYRNNRFYDGLRRCA